MDKIKLLKSDSVYNCKIGFVKSGVLNIRILDTDNDLSDDIYGGFVVLNEHNDEVMGDYSDYTTMYKESKDDTFYVSNGEIYVEQTIEEKENISVPEIELTPEQIEQNKLEQFEFAKTSKVTEMSNACSNAIENGINIGGKMYAYTIQDQSNMLNAMNLAKETGIAVPYHADGESCELYSYEAIAAIYMQEQMNLTMNQTYFNQLKLYILSLTDYEDIDTVNDIYYGTELTGEYLETYNNIVQQSNLIMQKLIEIDCKE